MWEPDGTSRQRKQLINLFYAGIRGEVSGLIMDHAAVFQTWLWRIVR